MNDPVCIRENELLDALGRGFIGADLEEHVQSCESCGELRIVAGALLDERLAAVDEAQLPGDGSVWWRMRLRHRNEAEAAARRSLVVGQAITLGIAVALGILFFASQLAAEIRHAATLIRTDTPLLVLFATSVFVALGAIGAGWVVVRQK